MIKLHDNDGCISQFWNMIEVLKEIFKMHVGKACHNEPNNNAYRYSPETYSDGVFCEIS